MLYSVARVCQAFLLLLALGFYLNPSLCFVTVPRTSLSVSIRSRWAGVTVHMLMKDFVQEGVATKNSFVCCL